MTAPAAADVHPDARRATRTHRPRPRRRPAAHITPEASWTALGHYLAGR
jgi:hypothetical protein